MAKKQPEIPPEGKVFTSFIDHLSATRQEHFDELVESTKRAGRAARARRKVLEAFAKSAGVDLSVLDALHAREWENLSEPSVRQKRGAERLHKLQRKSQRLALNSINKNRDRFEYQKGNPHTSLCRWRAVAFPTLVANPQSFNQGVVNTVSAPVGLSGAVAGENFIRAHIRVRSAMTSTDPALPLPAAAVDIITRHVFEAQVPHDGILSVAASYAPAGNIFLGAPGSCTFAGSASAEVVLFMFVEIDQSNGNRIELPLGSTTTILDRSIDATCDGKNSVTSAKWRRLPASSQQSNSRRAGRSRARPCRLRDISCDSDRRRRGGNLCRPKPWFECSDGAF